MAEGNGLLNRHTLSRRIEGSNPSVSAIVMSSRAGRAPVGAAFVPGRVALERFGLAVAFELNPSPSAISHLTK